MSGVCIRVLGSYQVFNLFFAFVFSAIRRFRTFSVMPLQESGTNGTRAVAGAARCLELPGCFRNSRCLQLVLMLQKLSMRNLKRLSDCFKAIIMDIWNQHFKCCNFLAASGVRGSEATSAPTHPQVLFATEGRGALKIVIFRKSSMIQQASRSANLLEAQLTCFLFPSSAILTMMASC